jgi:hypothetical protein
MSSFHSTILASASAAIPQTSRIVDTILVIAGSFAANLADTTGSPSIVVALEGSDAVPPNGAMVNQGGTGINAGWVPPSTSWQPLKDAAGVAITATVTANGTKLLFAPPASLLTRWVRMTATPTGVVDGTISVDAFLRDSGS